MTKLFELKMYYQCHFGYIYDYAYTQSGPGCHQYNLNIGHSAPQHQYIFVDNDRCGSICDETNLTLNNTIHLKVKYDEFHERSISFPISCKYQSAKTLDDPTWSEYWWWNTDYGATIGANRR